MSNMSARFLQISEGLYNAFPRLRDDEIQPLRTYTVYVTDAMSEFCLCLIESSRLLLFVSLILEIELLKDII